MGLLLCSGHNHLRDAEVKIIRRPVTEDSVLRDHLDGEDRCGTEGESNMQFPIIMMLERHKQEEIREVGGVNI